MNDNPLNFHADPETDTPEKQAVARQSTWVSVVVNVVLSTLQVVVGWFANSQALLADGLHSLSDLASDFVVLLANHHSSKDADEDHPYGHHRFETAASMLLGLLLLTVGLGMLWRAGNSLYDRTAIPEVDVIALYVALTALVSKELLFRYMKAAAEKVRSSMLLANAWHARSDAASSLVVAIGITGNLMGFPLLDPVAALVVGLMVTRMGWNFGWDALHDLMDRAICEKQSAQIEAILRGTPHVQGVHDLRTRKMGDMIMLDAHLEVDGDLSVREGHDIVSEARDRLMRDMPVIDVMLHLDPVQPRSSPVAAG